MTITLTAAQLRAARGLLDWTRADLADAAKVSPETVKNIEHGVFRPQEETAQRIIKAFEERDVMFTEHSGVRIADKTIKLYQGTEGYGKFLDFICTQMKDGGSTYQFNFPDSVLNRFGQDAGKRFLAFMSKVPNLVSKCLVPEGDKNFPATYSAYKWLPKPRSQTHTLPYYMFGDYVALLSSASEKDVLFIVVYAPQLAKFLREQFENLWKTALDIPQK